MTNVPDVVVVGAGPCGSTVAANLARHGANVTVFEEHAQIGIPSHCAGHVSISGLRRLKLFPPLKGIIENTFYGVRIYSPGGNQFCIRFSSPVTCVINRTLFDQCIAEMAEASGATFRLQSRVESLAVKDGFVEGVNINRKGQTEKVSARITIDSEGIPSRLVRQLGLPTADRGKIVNAVQAEIDGAENLESDVVEVFLGTKYAPGLYAWLIPKRDRKASVGLATNEGNPKELLWKLMRKHPVASVKLRKARVLRTVFHPITLGGPISRTYSNGFLAVGDAASQVKPTTGGGLILGMTCAEIAAQVAFKSLKNHDSSTRSLREYQKRCDHLVAFDMSVMLKIRRMLDAMPDRRIDELVNLCAVLGLDKILMNVKEVDFQGKSILRILRSPRVLAVLGYLLFSFLPANL